MKILAIVCILLIILSGCATDFGNAMLITMGVGGVFVAGGGIGWGIADNRGRENGPSIVVTS